MLAALLLAASEEIARQSEPERHLRDRAPAKPATSKLLSCSVCSFRTYHAGHLDHHLEVLHSDKPLLKTANVLVCPECAYATPHSGHFQRHLRRHTGEKSFRCTECGKRASRSDVLLEHLKNKHAESKRATVVYDP